MKLIEQSELLSLFQRQKAFQQIILMANVLHHSMKEQIISREKSFIGKGLV
jgi:hypothetical protein